MSCYKVKPLAEKRDMIVTVPGSKSMTNRALLMAAMSEGRTELSGVQFSDDSMHFLNSLRDLGFSTEIDQVNNTVVIYGMGGRIPKGEASIYVGSAGTAARFLTAFTAMNQGRYRIDASEQMQKRPMRELLVALEQLGARFIWLGKPYHFPFEVQGMGRVCANKRVELNIDRSSQFLSALLMTAPIAIDCLEIILTGSRNAKSYVEMTKQMMEQFGHPGVRQLSENNYVVKYGTYHVGKYEVEPDVSAACYFYGIAAITGGSAIVNFVRRDSLQGDMRFIDLLEQMGCEVRWLKNKEAKEVLQLVGPKSGELKGIDINMNDFSDQALTLAAIAPYADGPVKIRGISHIRGQESDRMQVMVNELGRMGVSCEIVDDGVEIIPGKPHGAVIQTYDDHRVAMAFAITGLKCEGIVIENPECCRKTFANYFEVFEQVNYQ